MSLHLANPNSNCSNNGRFLRLRLGGGIGVTSTGTSGACLRAWVSAAVRLQAQLRRWKDGLEETGREEGTVVRGG